MESKPVESQKRQTAYKISIKTLKNGKYIQKEGWQPNYVEHPKYKISRANIIAVVISQAIQEMNSTHFIIDDGTENIQVRSFETLKIDLKLGDLINIIGRPRDYNNERYIIPEIIKKLKNPKWAELRKKEIEQEEEQKKEETKIQTETKKEGTKKQIEEVYEEENQDIKILLKLIKEKDSGNGAIFEEVIEKSQIKDAEKIISNLMKEGEIFEIAPGRLKVLD